MPDVSEAYGSEVENNTRLFKGSSGTSPHIAQLMVFLNGLVLTITAYATLNIFVQQMVEDSLTRMTTQTHAQVEEIFTDVQQAMYAMGVLTSLTDGGEGLAQSIAQAPIEEQIFDQVYFILKLPEGASVQQKMTSLLEKQLSNENYESFIVSENSAFSSYIHAQVDAHEKDRSQFIIPNLKGARIAKDENGTVFAPMAIVETVYKDGKEFGYLVGLFQLQDILELWTERNPSLSQLQVNYKDGHATFMLYDYYSGDKSIRKDNTQSLTMNLADKSFSILTQVKLSEQEQFLKNIPVLLLLFGLTLTGIGTLYVRNNQRQSLRLSEMNMQLAQKNYDLNSQIKERERLNAALRKSERENRAIIDSVSDIIFEIDTQGKIQFLNETWYEVTGLNVDQVLGKNLFDLLYPQDQAEQRDNFNQMVKGKKQAYRVFTRLKNSEGNYRSVELAMSMIRYDENKNAKVVGTITDIEERRRTERALSEAEKKYRTIVENAAGGIYQIGVDGHYLSANPAMARILGYASADQMMREVRDANTQIYTDFRKRMKHLRDVEEARDMKSIEMEARRKDGELIWIAENTRAVFNEKNELEFFEGSIEDITKRKSAEMKLQDAKVQSDLASRAKSEFLANMSHELRTPLNAIIGFSEIIKNEAFGPLGSKEYLDYARDIYDGGRKLLNVINEILDVSRIETGERTLNEGVVNIARVVNSCFDLLGPKVEASHMTITGSIPADLPDIIAEELAVKQMLMNLLSNAVKFTQQGGLITVSAEESENGTMRISVTDTGVGMDESEIEKALSPFGQLGSMLSKSSAGTGLGLTLVDSLIKLHDGRLELLSQKGIGTTATLVFPQRRVTRHNSSRGIAQSALPSKFSSIKTDA